MRVLGIETSCDDTGVAVYDTAKGLLAQTLHSQIAMHERYGGVVPELASRDHIHRLAPQIEVSLEQAGLSIAQIDAVGYTAGPGLAGALLVGATVAVAIAFARGIPALPVHHLEGHLLSPLLGADPPAFPFVALLVSGGHTQLLEVRALGRYRLLGDTLDDAAGEAFDKSAKLLGLPYPGGPAIAAAAAAGRPGRIALPRPMLRSGDLDFSFSGLKTAVLTQVRRAERAGGLDDTTRADIAHAVQEAIVDVLCAKALDAVRASGIARLVVAGGVSANRHLRARLAQAAGHTTEVATDAVADAPAPVGGTLRVYFPAPALSTDNGAMIAFAAASRLAAGETGERSGSFAVRPRWPLESLAPPRPAD